MLTPASFFPLQFYWDVEHIHLGCTASALFFSFLLCWCAPLSIKDWPPLVPVWDPRSTLQGAERQQSPTRPMWGLLSSGGTLPLGTAPRAPTADGSRVPADPDRCCKPPARWVRCSCGYPSLVFPLSWWLSQVHLLCLCLRDIEQKPLFPVTPGCTDHAERLQKS